VPDLTAVLWPLTTLNRRPESSRRPEPPRAPPRRGIDVGAVITRALTAAGLMK
jgi:feruloyl esterase